MSHSQLKINNQAIALVLFMLVNLTSCNCGNNDNQDPSSPETSSDTTTGETNAGGTNTGTENTEEQTTGTENTEEAITVPISITPQRIDELLQELKNKLNSIDRSAYLHLKRFLNQVVRAKEDISDLYQQASLLAAIQYNIPRDVLKVAIDRLGKDIINTPYKDLTFLQYAAYYDHTDAINLLLKKGAKKDLETTKDVVLEGKNIPAGSTAYAIAVALNRQEAIKIKELKP